MITGLVRYILGMVFAFVELAICAHATNTHIKWQTYNNPDYGFKIDYPSNMPFHSDRPLPAETAMLPVCRYTVACFLMEGDVLHKTSLSAAGVAVSILREEKTEANCYTIEDDPHPAKTRIIHGTVFHYGESSDAGAMQSQGITAYRVFYQHVCFEVALATTGSDLDPRDLDDMGLKPMDRRTMRRISREMDKMLLSFTLIGPVKDGADWNVFRDWGCGGVFEYPAAAQVQKKVEYSNAAFASDNITCEQAFTYKGREYQVAVKVNLKDEDALNVWLSHSGYPLLAQMRVVAEGSGFTEFRDETRVYIFDGRTVFIFTVSDGNHQSISSESDRVFEHFVESFRK